MSKRLCLAAWVSLLATAASCTQPATEPTAADRTGNASAAGTPATFSVAATRSVDLQPVDRLAFDRTIKEFRGRVVLVDFWATWCAPCVEQLPHSAALATQFGADRLAVVTVSMDNPDAAGQAATVVASKALAATQHLISALGGGPEAAEAFELDGGSVPHYKLYDKTGQLRRTFSVDPLAEKQFTTEDIAAAVAALMAE